MENSLSSRRAVLEIAVCYALILATLWSARPLRTYIGMLALMFLAGFFLFGARRQGTFGLGFKGLRESLWALGLAILLVTIVFICAADLGTLRYHQMLRPHIPLSGYLVWSFIQEFILQNLFLARLLRLFRPAWAITGAGLLMSFAHLPNPMLVAATLLWGVAACALFFYYRNLYVVAFIHFLFGISLAMCMPPSLLPNMRVGHGYAHFKQLSRPLPDAAGSAQSFGAAKSLGAVKSMVPQPPPGHVR